MGESFNEHVRRLRKQRDDEITDRLNTQSEQARERTASLSRDILASREMWEVVQSISRQMKQRSIGFDAKLLDPDFRQEYETGRNSQRAHKWPTKQRLGQLVRDHTIEGWRVGGQINYTYEAKEYGQPGITNTSNSHENLYLGGNGSLYFGKSLGCYGFETWVREEGIVTGVNEVKPGTTLYGDHRPEGYTIPAHITVPAVESRLAELTEHYHLNI